MHVCAPLSSATQSSRATMRLAAKDSPNAAMDASRLATRDSSPVTIFVRGSNTMLCNAEGSSARTVEPAAVADSASKARPIFVGGGATEIFVHAGIALVTLGISRAPALHEPPHFASKPKKKKERR